MAKAKLPPGPLKVFSDRNITAILDANGDEVVHWMGFDDSSRTRAEHVLLARELVRRFNADGVEALGHQTVSPSGIDGGNHG